MDQTLIELVKQSPILACFVALVWIGTRWIEKQEQKCHTLHAKLTEGYEARCVEMRHATGDLSVTLGKISGALDRCAESHTALERTMRERS